MAHTRPNWLSEHQWWQIRLMRAGIYFMTIQAVLVGAGSAIYIVSVMSADRRRRAQLSVPPPVRRS